MAKQATRRKPRGLGDTVETVAKATGMDKVAKAYEKVTGKDCGCNERKEFLNKKFPYINEKEKCMDDMQVSYWEEIKKKYFSQKKSSVVPTKEDMEGIISLYNAIFRTNLAGCKGCQINVYTDRIEKVYQNVKKELKSGQD